MDPGDRPFRGDHPYRGLQDAAADLHGAPGWSKHRNAAPSHSEMTSMIASDSGKMDHFTSFFRIFEK
jgi:hypothetical protein